MTGQNVKALLTTLMSAPDVSSLCRRSAPMGRISTRTPMPWFPMACSRRNESFCRSLRSIPPLAASAPAPGRAPLQELHAEPALMGLPGIFGFCRASRRRRRLGPTRVDPPRHSHRILMFEVISWFSAEAGTGLGPSLPPDIAGSSRRPANKMLRSHPMRQNLCRSVRKL
jgi:hypothetical protein